MMNGSTRLGEEGQLVLEEAEKLVPWQVPEAAVELAKVAPEEPGQYVGDHGGRSPVVAVVGAADQSVACDPEELAGKALGETAEAEDHAVEDPVEAAVGAGAEAVEAAAAAVAAAAAAVAVVVGALGVVVPA